MVASNSMAYEYYTCLYGKNQGFLIAFGCVNILSKVVDVTPTGFGVGVDKGSTEMSPLRG